MKAIRVHEFGEPQVMQLEEVPDLVPGPGQVVVRVHAIGVNPVDTYIRSGSYAKRPVLPYTPGLDAAGTVEALGENVGHLKRGDRVYVAGSLSGTYAEQVLCEQSQIHSLPEKISFSQGAALGVPYATAYYALHLRAKARPGEFVLVHGASGGVGLAAVQLAKSFGMHVIGTAGTIQGRRLVEEQGAYCVLDHADPAYLEEIDRKTCGHGADVILEMLANVNLNKDFAVLAMRGRVVVIGNRGTLEFDPRAIMKKHATVLGMLLFNATAEELIEVHAALGAGLENGTLKPIIGSEMPLADAAQAHQDILKPGAYGKIILMP